MSERPLVVHKVGGTSLGDAERIVRAARILATASRRRRLVAVAPYALPEHDVAAADAPADVRVEGRLGDVEHGGQDDLAARAVPERHQPGLEPRPVVREAEVIALGPRAAFLVIGQVIVGRFAFGLRAGQRFGLWWRETDLDFDLGGFEFATGCEVRL